MNWLDKYNDEIPSAQKGKTITVNSKNDPRYKAYQDSLSLYNKYDVKNKQFENITNKNNIKTTKTYDNNFLEVENNKIAPIGTNTMRARYKTGNIINKQDKEFTKKDSEILKDMQYRIAGDYSIRGKIPIYKKPQQPVIVQQQEKPTKATRQDSLALYNNAIAKEKFYKNNKNYIENESRINFKDPEVVKFLINSIKEEKPLPDNTDFGNGENFLYKKDYKNRTKQINNNLYSAADFAEKGVDNYYNPKAPAILISNKIAAQGSKSYYSKKFGDTSEMPYYDKIAVKPFDLLIEKEKAQRVKQYGTNGVPKSYLNKDKKQKLAINSDKLTPIGLQNTNQEIQADIPQLRQQARIPKYYNVTDNNNQKFGGSDSTYRVENLDELRELPTELWDRKITPQYQDGGQLKETFLRKKDNTSVTPKVKNDVLKKETKQVLNDLQEIKNAKKFLTDYTKSPKFKERAINSGYGVADELDKYYSNPESVLYNPDYVNPLQKEIDSRVKGIKDVNVKFDYIKDRDPATTQSSYQQGKNIKIRPNTDKALALRAGDKSYYYDTPGTIAHEISHKIQQESNVNWDTTGPVNYIGGLNQKETKMLMSNHIGLYGVKNRDEILKSKDNPDRAYDLPHDMRASEMKSDIDAFRYELFKQGIYDAGKQDFEPQHLKKAKPSFIKDRLQKSYSDEDLIELMNKIAQNKETGYTPIAQDGGTFNSRQKRGIDLLIKEEKNIQKDKEQLEKTGIIKKPLSNKFKKGAEQLANRNSATFSQDSKSPEIRERDIQAMQNVHNKDLWLERPLIYMANPEKMLGDVGMKNYPNSEQDRQQVMQNRYNPYENNKLANSFKQGLGYVPEAAINVATVDAGASTLKTIANLYNPYGLSSSDLKEFNALTKSIEAQKARMAQQKWSGIIKPKNSIYSKDFKPALDINHERLGFDNLDELTLNNEDEFIKKYGPDFTAKDLSFYTKMKEMNSSRLKPQYEDPYIYNGGKNNLIENESFKNASEVTDSFLKTHEIDKDSYSPREILLSHLYAQGYDDVFNKRDGFGSYIPELYQPAREELETLIQKNKTKRPELFFRESKNFQVQDVWDETGKKLDPTYMSEFKPGWEYQPNSFYSTSLSPASTSFGEHLSRINVPEGQSILNINSTGNRTYMNELENVLPSKLRYRIDSIQDPIEGEHWIDEGTGYQKIFNKSIVNPYKDGGIIKDNNGYWDPNNWGKQVEIESPNITMEGVYEPLIGQSKETGEKKMMIPGKNYKFANTKSVIETPISKSWLDKYN